MKRFDHRTIRFFCSLFSRVGLLTALVLVLFSGSASAGIVCGNANAVARSFPIKPPVKQKVEFKNSDLRGPDADLLNLRFEPPQKSNGKKPGPAVRKASFKKHSVR